MLLEGFYTAEPPVEVSAGRFVSTVILNAEHTIFQGHFPDNPVTPGVCMMQIVKNLVENITGERLFLSSANNVKFMSIINPYQHRRVEIAIELVREENNEIKAKATATTDGAVALKMALQYRICE